MSFFSSTPPDEPTRADVERRSGVTVIEFGSRWCGICSAAQPIIHASLALRPAAQHLKVEDGPGRPLGRSFAVKLWPTLVVLKDGVEVGRVVRPRRQEQIDDLVTQAV